jgi:putative DNA primase/helicase
MYVFDELPRGFRVNDALLKRISGESVLTARQLFGRRFDYLPTFKVVLISNYDPGIPPDNDALKRRMVVIPFEQKAPKIDTTLRERLRLEHAQILNWMIEGAADWRKNGFKVPTAVKATGNDYFSTQDTIGQFIEERCIQDPAAKESAGALYEAWAEWCKVRGHQPGTATTFGTDLGRRGFGKCSARTKKEKVRGRSGIQLRK